MTAPAIALFLCELTGVMAGPWAAAGVECWCVDLQHPPGITREGNIVRVGADVLTFLPPRRDYLFACAFTDCTNLAVSGARWFKSKGLRGLAQGVVLASRCAEILEWTEAPFVLENPVSTLATYWRPADFTFDPCDFGDPYTKKTCLWTGGGFVMPPKSPVAPTLGSMMHRLPPSEDRRNLRSVTPAGFAQAVFEANYSAAGVGLAVGAGEVRHG
jgi:hypothetical protein